MKKATCPFANKLQFDYIPKQLEKLITMKKIILKNLGLKGEKLQATYLPDEGMNLISYKMNDIEIIDQSTRNLFLERKAGLGALIGPHFYHRKVIPTNFDLSLFPHIKERTKQGITEPFSHGIGRYVPWKYVSSETQIKAELHGRDLYKGTPLSVFEGQDFAMTYSAKLIPTGLVIEYTVTSENPSVIGLHYYYQIRGKSLLIAQVGNTYRDQSEWKSIPKSWMGKRADQLSFDLGQEADFGFIPKKKEAGDHNYQFLLNTESYSLHVDFHAASETEVCCQIYHPKESSFVCIEPISARNPPLPQLTSSILEVKLEIFDPIQ